MLFLLFISQVSANWWEGSHTTEINDTNIGSYIGQNAHVVLEFYAPWCHWCHRMFQDYEGVWEHFNSPSSPEYNSKILIARVNAQGNPNVIAKYQVYAYPTILFIPAGTQASSDLYAGNRTKWDFIRWANALMEKFEKVKIEEAKKLIEMNENSEREISQNLEEEYVPPHIKPEVHENHQDIPPEDTFNAGTDSNIPKEDLKESENSEKLQKKEDEIEPEHNHEEIEEEQSEEEEEYEIMYEVVVNEDAADFLAKWRTELNILSDLVKELHEDLASSITDLENNLQDIRVIQREEKLRNLERDERLEEKIEALDLHVLQRNRIESTQTRLNLTHLFIFSSLGFVVGCAVSIIFVKVQKPEKPFHNKV